MAVVTGAAPAPSWIIRLSAVTATAVVFRAWIGRRIAVIVLGMTEGVAVPLRFEALAAAVVPVVSVRPTAIIRAAVASAGRVSALSLLTLFSFFGDGGCAGMVFLVGAFSPAEIVRAD